ncbi:MAG TPA: MBL fold metallo-hydrolase [Gemmatimonadales bacterium]|nr:MBL fold metallo-hydrolase [Gemmatimonadales bacterium]
MIFKRFYDDGLAQASYLVGCSQASEAVVVDPLRDVAPYLATADAERVRITAVTETHIHADFLSGSRELAARTGAGLHLSAEGGPDWQYAFAAEDGARLLHDGDEIVVGNVRLRVLHTPGHTPEHLSFLVTDGAVATGPMGIITGDFVFVGDVGRPDLLEKAARVAGSAEAGARVLWRSLEKFRALPDHLQVWPGHGAGSACGKGLSAMPQSTVGYEKLYNWGVGAADEATFVRGVLADQPEPPAYFAEMKRRNRAGPPLLGTLPRPPRIEPSDIAARLEAGAVVVDIRPQAVAAAGRLPGTLSIPLNKSFVTWAGALLPYDTPYYFVTADGPGGESAANAARELAMIGLDLAAGFAGEEALEWWAEAGRELAEIPHLQPRDLARRSGAVVLDVRGAAEWRAGHVPGAPNIPLAELQARAAEVPVGRPLVLQCQGGGRSHIAASLLQNRGLEVVNLAGGYGAWEREGNPVER